MTQEISRPVRTPRRAPTGTSCARPLCVHACVSVSVCVWNSSSSLLSHTTLRALCARTLCLGGCVCASIYTYTCAYIHVFLQGISAVHCTEQKKTHINTPFCSLSIKSSLAIQTTSTHTHTYISHLFAVSLCSSNNIHTHTHITHLFAVSLRGNHASRNPYP